MNRAMCNTFRATNANHWLKQILLRLKLSYLKGQSITIIWKHSN